MLISGVARAFFVGDQVAPSHLPIETNVACTNVPNAAITVADALAVLQAAAIRKDL